MVDFCCVEIVWAGRTAYSSPGLCRNHSDLITNKLSRRQPSRLFAFDTQAVQNCAICLPLCPCHRHPTPEKIIFCPFPPCV